MVTTTEIRMPDKEWQASVRGVALAPGDDTEVRRQKLARIILDAMYQFLGLLDVDGTVLEINQAALDGAGICLAEVAGRPFWEARWWAVSEETRQRVRGMVEQARRGEFVRCDIEIFGELEGNKTIFVEADYMAKMVAPSSFTNEAREAMSNAYNSFKKGK